jgi:dTDP-4-dehydrorhamnose reductase
LVRLTGTGGISLIGAGQEILDIADPHAVANAAKGFDLVINAAAYTAVDLAESEQDAAFLANAEGPGIVAETCAKLGIPMIHFSTDYVFDGSKTAPWSEDDPVAPLNVYGASKEAGEQAVRRTLAQHIILRTSWVYAAGGSNFVRTMLRLGAQRSELQVVDDQFGAPTAAQDIAAAVLSIVRRILAGGATAFGTYHYTADGTTSWFGFAQAIFDRAERAWGRRPVVRPISSADYPTPAKRPRNSVLDCRKVMAVFAPPRRPWQRGLAEVLEGLLAESVEQRSC